MKNKDSSSQTTPGVNALFAQAVAQHQAGKYRDAEILYQRILTVDHRHVGALNNLGALHLQTGRFQEGILLIRRSLEINPNQPNAYINLGAAHEYLKRPDEALASYDRALSLRPDYAEAHNNRGNVLQDIKRLDEALASYDRALALQPDYAEAHNNRGNVLKSLDRLDEALASYDRAIALKPNFAKAHNNRGIVLRGLDRLDEALASYDRALALQPDYAEAHNNRGNALEELKQSDEALICYNKAIAIKPDLPYVGGSWLHSKMLSCNWEGFDAACATITNAVGRDEKAVSPFTLLAIPSSLTQQHRCAQTYVQDKYPASSMPLWKGERYAHNRVRIGYFSADFREHPISHLIARFIEIHDRKKFEVIGFSFRPSANDAWRQRLDKGFDRFFEVGNRTDKEIAAVARELEIDIAIDLGGHTKNARTGVFALRPAPIQVNYLGYPGTMGADYIDYLIADHILIPEEHQRYYNEKIVYLPNSYQVNDSTKMISDRSFSRAELGFPDGAFVFCCFNNHYKITPDLFDIWMQLVCRVEGSVLWLSEGNTTVVNNLRLEAGKRGVSPDRLVFAPRIESLAEHLARLRQADLFLDTFYYNAHTTASDALWAGLPVLTCLGNTFAGRVAASLLNAIGLPELVTRRHAEYEALALELATQPGRLADIHRKLATNRTTQPLFDTARFTRDIEEAYLKMHERHLAGLPPDHIVVDENRRRMPENYEEV
ncbi:MAG: tetratricopeptide repeat protein [Bacteroidota bacterium]